MTIPTHITVYLVVLRVSLYSSQSPCLTQPILILITVCLMVLRLSLYSSWSLWWSSEYSCTHHSFLGGTQLSLYSPRSLWWHYPILITVYLLAQTIPILITVSLVVLRLSKYSSQSLWWPSDYPFTHHSLPGGSDNLYTHHSLPGGTQTIPILITDSLVVLRHFPLLITVSLVALRLSLYTSQSTLRLIQSLYLSQCPWSYSDYAYTHHSLPGGNQTIPILIRVSLVVLRLSLYSSQ